MFIANAEVRTFVADGRFLISESRRKAKKRGSGIIREKVASSALATENAPANLTAVQLDSSFPNLLLNILRYAGYWSIAQTLGKATGELLDLLGNRPLDAPLARYGAEDDGARLLDPCIGYNIAHGLIRLAVPDFRHGDRKVLQMMRDRRQEVGRHADQVAGEGFAPHVSGDGVTFFCTARFDQPTLLVPPDDVAGRS